MVKTKSKKPKSARDPNLTLYMETTMKTVGETCGEIETLLMEMEAISILKDIDRVSREIDGIAFTVPFKDTFISIRLPFNWKAIQQLAERGKTGYADTEKEDRARMVAARQILRWIESQFALWQCEMAEVAEIFLPYIVNPKTGQTAYQQIEADPGLLLGTGK